MLVSKIIESKQIRDIVSVKPGDSILSVAQTLAARRIGAVVVSTDGVTVEGILSERDIVKAIGTRGVGSVDLKVRDLMTSTVKSCAPGDTALSAIEMMSEGRFRHMPVLEDGKLVGLISIGDVVKARISEIQAENSALTDMISNTW